MILIPFSLFSFFLSLFFFFFFSFFLFLFLFFFLFLFLFLFHFQMESSPKLSFLVRANSTFKIKVPPPPSPLPHPFSDFPSPPSPPSPPLPPPSPYQESAESDRAPLLTPPISVSKPPTSPHILHAMAELAEQQQGGEKGTPQRKGEGRGGGKLERGETGAGEEERKRRRKKHPRTVSVLLKRNNSMLPTISSKPGFFLTYPFLSFSLFPFLSLFLPSSFPSLPF